MKQRQRKRKGLPERVLIVEDDDDTRKMLVSAITEEGFEPIPALDGEHALRTALAVEPSAIILDLMLPEHDGEEFANAYHRQSTLNAPIVVVSAKRDAEAIGRRIGARAVFPKPLDLAAFTLGLRTAMHPRAAGPQLGSLR